MPEEGLKEPNKSNIAVGRSFVLLPGVLERIIKVEDDGVWISDDHLSDKDMGVAMSFDQIESRGETYSVVKFPYKSIKVLNQEGEYLEGKERTVGLTDTA